MEEPIKLTKLQELQIQFAGRVRQMDKLRGEMEQLQRIINHINAQIDNIERTANGKEQR